MRETSAFKLLIDQELVQKVNLHSVFSLCTLENTPSVVPDEVIAVLAMVLGAGDEGNTCVHLEALHLPNIRGFNWPTNAHAWESTLLSCRSLVRHSSDAPSTSRTPFVIDRGRLYVARTFEEEIVVVQHLIRLHEKQQLTVVLGGPGTGKTTYISGKLIEMFSSENACHIKLSLIAPTGKAARRMRQSLMRALERSDAPEDVVKKILDSASARTVHKLLGLSPRRTPKYKFNSDPKKRLKCNLLIVDEASMMSLSLMYHLLEALEPDTSVWLVGDPDQLASVDAGSVLGDIAQVTVDPGTRFHNCFVPRTEQHRYPEESRINRLVKCVRDAKSDKDVDLFLQILSESSSDVSWIDPKKNPVELNALKDLVINNANTVVSLAEQGKLQESLSALAEVQILCAHREGPMGVAGWNRLVQLGVHSSTEHPYYFGRPVMITKNDDSLQLANGDVGVVCNVDGIRKVAFEGLNAPVTVPVNSLPAVETVHGLTIHKSQGSEYAHVIVVLPTHASRIVTRELLYTAISRPTQKLTIVATEEILRHAVNSPIKRATGLADRL